MNGFASKMLNHFNIPLVSRTISDVKLDSLALFVHNYLLQERSIHLQNKKGLFLPTSMHLEVSTYCPKHCLGCYIPEEDRHNTQVMDSSVANLAVQLGINLGIKNYNFIGGEPLREKILPLINALLIKNPSLSFYCCSNGDMLASEHSNPYLEAVISKRNFSPGISIDGFETTNDLVRGKNCFNKILSASEYLHSKKRFYGAVTTLRNINAEEISSPEFLNFIASQGFKYIFYSQSSDLDKQLLDESVKRILSVKKRNVFVYFNNYGHVDDLSKHNNTRSIYVNKDGTILNNRLERISLSVVDEGIEKVVSSHYWRKKFEEDKVIL